MTFSTVWWQKKSGWLSRLPPFAWLCKGAVEKPGESP